MYNVLLVAKIEGVRNGPYILHREITLQLSINGESSETEELR